MASGWKLFYPLKTYCYINLQTSLQRMLLRTDLIENCGKWTAQPVTEGTLADVYEWKVWNEFLYYSGKPFFAELFSFAFLLNIDWFQPNISYSVGAIYLAVLASINALQTRKYVWLVLLQAKGNLSSQSILIMILLLKTFTVMGVDLCVASSSGS